MEPVDRIAIPRLCEQLLLEPELTLEKAIVISSQIVTAVAKAKIIAQEAIDHVQAAHSLTGINWRKCGRQNGGKQSTFDMSRKHHAILTPSDTSKSGFDCDSLLCIVNSTLK